MTLDIMFLKIVNKNFFFADVRMSGDPSSLNLTTL